MILLLTLGLSAQLSAPEPLSQPAQLPSCYPRDHGSQSPQSSAPILPALRTRARVLREPGTRLWQDQSRMLVGLVLVSSQSRVGNAEFRVSDLRTEP